MALGRAGGAPPIAEHLVYLDLLRGVAALAVVSGHVRAFVLVDFAAVANPTILVKAFYLVTSLGHQAVIAFFALSGYLVGGRALGAMLAGRWSFRSYFVARLSRLWTVVAPALVLTLVLDLAGSALGGGDGYAGGQFAQLSSGPQPNVPADHSVMTFFGNLFFLQSITVPVFGSNGPLWSLANEFWYYVVFPLAAAALLIRQRVRSRALGLVVAVVVAFLLPANLMLLGLIWVAGAVAFLGTTLSRMRAVFGSWYYLSAALAVVLAVQVTGYGRSGLAIDLLGGLAWAVLIPGLAALKNPRGIVAKVSLGISEISYTLYAVHFPILSFVYFVMIANRQYQPGLIGLGLWLLMVAAALLVSTGMWWLFERNTPGLRAHILERLRLRSRMISL